MASDKAVETRKLAVTTADQIVDWGFPALTEIHLTADETTVRVDFDQPTDDSSFPLLSENTQYTFTLPVHKLHVSTSSGTANLYIVGVR